MKSMILIILMSCATSSNSQNNYVNPKPYPKVKISDWGERAVIFMDGFWENNEDQIVSKVGKEQFEDIKKYSSRFQVPCQMQVFCEDIDGKPKKNPDSLNSKLAKLDIYLIATFSHRVNSTRTVDYTIVSAPFQLNKSWDMTAKWDTIYFVVPSAFVQKTD